MHELSIVRYVGPRDSLVYVSYPDCKFRGLGEMSEHGSLHPCRCELDAERIEDSASSRQPVSEALGTVAALFARSTNSLSIAVVTLVVLSHQARGEIRTA